MNARFQLAALLVVAVLSSTTAASQPNAPDRGGDAAKIAPVVMATGTGQADWQWPVRSPWEIRREFVAPESRYGAGHRGIDLSTGPGDEIVSPADGTVFFTGLVVDRSVISIRHANGLTSSFEPVTSELAAGQNVVRGDRIGTVAAGGHCADSCVHFGVRLHGQYVSPRLPLGSLPRAILLPMDDG